MTIITSGSSQRILTGLYIIAIISIVTFVRHFQHFSHVHLNLFSRPSAIANNSIIIESSSSSSSSTTTTITALTRTNLNSIAPPAHLPSSTSIGTMSTNISSGGLLLPFSEAVERYLKEDYKAFIFATHPLHGLLLLHCTRKKKKGPHYQAPGGHVDKEDFDYVIANQHQFSSSSSSSSSNSSSTDQGPELLMQACKMGAARELYEETGMDFRSTVERYTQNHFVVVVHIYIMKVVHALFSNLNIYTFSCLALSLSLSQNLFLSKDYNQSI